ncbi:MAG: response regulator transcription factor [Candidatus Marinimicrobia bacterium]|nr:response regulator transcription factor [Candidatus Neomarinimicrobiota bacterium]
MKKKILIIEDEVDLVKGLKINLVDEGYEVEWSFDGKEGLRKALDETPDLIILDIMLPGMDGLDVCKELRQKQCNIPIIMLTAKGSEIDKVIGLEIGADDYVTKPFSVRELLARVKAHLRRLKRENKFLPNSYTIGDVEVDFTKYSAQRNKQTLEFTSIEMDVLKYLITHKGEVVTRDALLDVIWGYKSYPMTRTIDNHILKLRKKIEHDPAHPKHILSVYGSGYRFVD